MIRLTTSRLAFLTIFLFAGAVRADTITLRGSTIPLRSCVVQDFKSGRVFFRDGGSRRQRREIEDVVAIGFSGLPALDEAEHLLAENDLVGGLAPMLEALVAADSEVERVWLHMRLSQVHDSRGELVPAASHAAAVFLLRDESFWQRLAPRSVGVNASFPAVSEAVARLREAKKTIRDQSLIRIVDRLLATIGPAYVRMEKGYRGPEVRPGTTESGVLITAITGGVGPGPGAGAGTRSGAGTGTGTSTGTGTDAGTRARTGTRSEPRTTAGAPDEIERALVERRGADALAMCERIASGGAGREPGRFFHQYGRALVAVGRPEDASVMFMRVAVLHENSPSCGPALLDAAVICRDVFGNIGAAERLARRAIEAAPESESIRERARGVLATLSEGKNR